MTADKPTPTQPVVIHSMQEYLERYGAARPRRAPDESELPPAQYGAAVASRSLRKVLGEVKGPAPCAQPRTRGDTAGS